MQTKSLFLIFLLLWLPCLVWAEGSKNLTPQNGGSPTLSDPTNTIVGYLQHDDGINSNSFLKPSTFAGFQENHRLYIHVKAGETLYYGVRRIATNIVGNQDDLVLTLRYGAGAGTIAKTNTLARNQSSTNHSSLLPQPGVIGTPGQALNGPNIAGVRTNGYDPLSYTNTTGQDRSFYIEFTQLNEGTLNATYRKSWYDLWDFTVVGADNQEKSGRLFSKQWSFTAGANTNMLSERFSLFPLIPSKDQASKFFVKRVELAGMQPFGFLFMCNEFGSTEGTGRMTVAERRRSQLSSTGYPDFRIFVQNPDPLIYPSADQPTVTATGASFCNSTQGGSMALTFKVSEKGSALIILDLNGTPGYQQGTQDVLIEADFPSSGYHTVVWNGRNGLNALVPTGTQVKIIYKSTASPVHFPLWDAEYNKSGFRVSNVRPGTDFFYNTLHWDDQLVGAAFQPQTELFGVNSTPGVHKWGASTADGDNKLINTWTYGHLEESDFVVSHHYDCDFDGDGVNNDTDIDQDNDGIPDMVEGFGVNPSQLTARNVPLYLDPIFVHPTRGSFRDRNRDGVNDIFDTDMDGIPNHRDLDSDGDGMPDAIEANNGVVPLAYNSLTGTISGSVGANGMPDAAETSPESGLSVFPLPDADGDSHPNAYDLDSDNDGITDRVEAQATFGFVPASGQDLNRNGLDDAYDPSCAPCGAITGFHVWAVNTDGKLGPDFLDLDTDGDGSPDWIEGFDDNTNGEVFDDLLKRSEIFEVATGNSGKYKKETSDNNKKPYWLRHSSNSPNSGTVSLDGEYAVLSETYLIPDFLNPSSEYYYDSNQNGLIDLYDPETDGSPSITPRSETSLNDVDFRDADTVTPLPVTLLDLRAQWQQADVLVTWATASEKNSDRFIVERSADALSFHAIGEVKAKGNSTSIIRYSLLDRKPLTGTNYYRLRQVDTDGSFHYSKIVAVQSEGGLVRPGLKLYPNPADTALELELAPLTEPATVRITDMAGRLVQSVQMEAGAGGVRLPVRDLPAGVYLVTLTKAHGTEHARFVKK